MDKCFVRVRLKAGVELDELLLVEFETLTSFVRLQTSRETDCDHSSDGDRLVCDAVGESDKDSTRVSKDTEGEPVLAGVTESVERRRSV